MIHKQKLILVLLRIFKIKHEIVFDRCIISLNKENNQ